VKLLKKTESNYRQTIIIAVALAGIISSLTLWLLDSYIKYAFFAFEVFVIVVLYLLFSNFDFKIVTKRFKIARFHFGPVIDAFLVMSAASLLLTYLLGVQSGFIQLILALLVASILPGYALLNIFGLNRYFSTLERLVLSYVLSFAFTGALTLGLLFMNENIRLYCASSVWIILGLISLLKNRKRTDSSTLPSFARNVDSLGIVAIIAFFALSFFFIYPGFTLLAGTDASQHYASSILLWRSPDLYNNSPYLFAHLHESLLIALSNSPAVATQLALLTLNLMLPLAFYIMAKQFLSKIDARLPSIATVFWVLFTNSFGGFSWLYFAYLKVSSSGQTQLQLLNSVADKTYNGTIYGVLGLWYVPVTISFALLMVAIFLLRKTEIPTSKFLVLFSFTTCALYLTHVTEAVVFAIFLSVYGLISKNTELKINAALEASTFSFILAGAVYYYFSEFTARFTLNLGLLVSIILPVSLLLFSLIVRNLTSLRSIKIGYHIHVGLGSKVFVSLLFFFYLVALFSWSSFTDSFHTWQVDTIGLVPWFMYPLMLGVTGLLTIITLYCVAKDAGAFRSFRFFIAFMIFSFVFGTIVSIANLYFFNTDYWEKRFIWFIKIPLSLLAPIPIILSLDRLRKQVTLNRFSIKAISVVLIGAVVLYGISTTFLNIEYWNINASNPLNFPSSNELSAVAAFKEILDKDPKAWLVTVTSSSASVAGLAAPADTLGLSQLVSTASTFEMLFTQLYRHSAYSHPYIYIDSGDRAVLNGPENQLLVRYLAMLPIVFDNVEVTIYNATRPSFPQVESENELIVPFDSYATQQNLLASHCILSNGLYNFTVAYDMDHNALDRSTLLLSFDPPLGNSVEHTFRDNFNQTLQSWYVSKGTWHIEDGRLIGGENGKYLEGVLLSPMSAENFTTTVTISPLDCSLTQLNYARIIYSWVDSKNYHFADIFFNSDHHVYVLFRDFVNGVETDFPTWPGLKTGFQWTFGDQFNMKLMANSTLSELSINGTSLFRSDAKNVQGQIGLGYSRFNSIAFDNFSVNYSNNLNLRPVGDYVRYLNSGGRLIVLNTNGYGFFADELFSISSSTVGTQLIKDNAREINLPYEISMPLIVCENDTENVVSSYIGSSGEVPYILEEDYAGGGRLLYVNLYPIIQAMQNSNNQSIFYPLLGRLLEYIPIAKLAPTNPLSNFNGYVKDVHLEKSVSITTTSILFPATLKLGKIEIRSDNSPQVFYNVTEIRLGDYSRIKIKTDNATTQGGNGLYSVFQLNSPFTIEPDIGAIKVEITADNGTFDLYNVSSVSVTPNCTLTLQTKVPTVSALGVTFLEFYLQNYRQFKNPVSGQNLNVTGLTEFSISISDNYKAISNLTLGSSFQGASQAIQFNFLSTLPAALFWSLMLLPVFIGVFILLTLRKPSSETIKSNVPE
jgi:hypothetical protein